MKRLLDIEDVILDWAKLILCIGTIKDSVDAALGETVRAAKRREHVDRAALKRFSPETQGLADDEVMTEAWR